MNRVLLVFTSIMFTSATALADAPARCPLGLRLPAQIDENKPLVILIHGLDCNEGVFWRMGRELHDAGYAATTFNYSSEQSILEAGAALGNALETLHKRFPRLRIDIVAHSMGGLVARDYIEGDGYAGGVDRLIMIAPPNHGSPWARLEFLARWRLHTRNQDDWRVTALVGAPLSAAAKDLLPDSECINRLNARERRAGVRYTIIAGRFDDPGDAVGEWARGLEAKAPDKLGAKWLMTKVANVADKVNVKQVLGEGDGVVTLESAKLDGVADFIVLSSDHITLCQGDATRGPSAWPAVKERLTHP